MTEKQWIAVSAIGLTIFNIAVLNWGLNLFFNGSDDARYMIMLSSVITVPVLFATVFMNFICLLCLVVPETVQTRVMNLSPSPKLKKAWRVIENIIDIFD